MIYFLSLSLYFVFTRFCAIVTCFTLTILKLVLLNNNSFFCFFCQVNIFQKKKLSYAFQFFFRFTESRTLLVKRILEITQRSTNDFYYKKLWAFFKVFHLVSLFIIIISLNTQYDFQLILSSNNAVFNPLHQILISTFSHLIFIIY